MVIHSQGSQILDVEFKKAFPQLQKQWNFLHQQFVLLKSQGLQEYPSGRAPSGRYIIAD